MTPLARIARLSAAYLASNLARTAIAFGLTLAIGRGLGAERFGRWILCTTWASTVTVISDLGFGVLLTRDGARRDAVAGRLLLSSLLPRLAVAIPLGALLALAAPRLTSDPEAVSGMHLAAVLGIAGAAYGCFGSLLRAQPAWLPATLALETTWLAVQLLGSWWMIHAGMGVAPLVLLAALLQAGQILVATVLWRRVFGARGSVTAVTGAEILALVRRAVPFAAAGIVANLQTRLAPLMLGAWNTDLELGLFAAASRFGRAARLAPQALSAGALPVLSREFGARDAERSSARPAFRVYARGLVALSVGVALPCIVLAPRLVRAVYGASFANAAPALVWIGVGLLPALLNAGKRVALFAAGGEAVALRWSVAALGIQAIAGAALIPRFGAVGAAIGIAVAEASICVPLWKSEVSSLKAEKQSPARRDTLPARVEA